MAMSVYYENLDGELISENRGGTETFYTSDPLGSVVECRNSAGTRTYAAEYWAYGEVRTSTGSNPSPWFFCGTLGYHGVNFVGVYVRARGYKPQHARWLTVDPLWPGETAYVYVSDRPTGLVDPHGEHAIGAGGFVAKEAIKGGLIIGGGVVTGPVIIAVVIVACAVVVLTMPTGGSPCSDSWRSTMTRIYHRICDQYKNEFGIPSDKRVCKVGDDCRLLCWKLLINEYCGWYRKEVRDNCYDKGQQVWNTHTDQIQGALTNYYRCQSLISDFPGGCDCAQFDIERTIIEAINRWVR